MPLLIDALQAGSELFSRGFESLSASSKQESGYLKESDEVGLMLFDKAPPS